MGTYSGGRACQGDTDNKGLEGGSFPELGPLAGCTNPAHPGRSSKTHQSTVGHGRLRDPAGEWAAGERVRSPQSLAPDRGVGRGERGGSPGQDPEDPKSNGSCGHHQPERKERSQSWTAFWERKVKKRQQDTGRKEAGEAWSGGRLPQPLTLAGAGSPSVIAGSKDIVGKANGAREVSCSRSRWPKSPCHGEQGDGSPVLEL